MNARASIQNLPQAVTGDLMKTGMYIRASGLSPALVEPLCYRVSQINACAYCIDMHHEEAIQLGKTKTRLHFPVAWRECHFYTDPGRAALTFAEAVTARHVDDAAYCGPARHFSQKEIADLTLAMVNINSRNLLNAVFTPVPGMYRAGMVAARPESAQIA